VSAVTEEAHVDLDRQRRCGFPEVIYGEGKTPRAMVQIVEELSKRGQAVLATRVSVEQAALIKTHFPDVLWNETARTLRLPRELPEPTKGHAVVVTAGTSDRPVAEEALETLQWMNCRTELIVDVGVAGPHRLISQLDNLRDADAIVVVAGMEGALPSVVGGHVDCPVIAVPTSVGYGANFGGLSALLGMLNSCAANVTVVNIDAGFKGGYIAGLIARRSAHRD
jgi:NCAIR mutase (PurE)-related protein